MQQKNTRLVDFSLINEINSIEKGQLVGLFDLSYLKRALETNEWWRYALVILLLSQSSVDWLVKMVQYVFHVTRGNSYSQVCTAYRPEKKSLTSLLASLSLSQSTFQCLLTTANVIELFSYLSQGGWEIRQSIQGCPLCRMPIRTSVFAQKNLQWFNLTWELAACQSIHGKSN